MKIHEPDVIRIEIEEKEIETLERAYNILERLSDKLKEYRGKKEIEYSVFGIDEEDFYDLLDEIGDSISDIREY
jgi:viroplasmin and RNaseH domain-containing protein